LRCSKVVFCHACAPTCEQCGIPAYSVSRLLDAHPALCLLFSAAENRRLKDEAESSKSQVQALQMLNAQIIETYALCLRTRAQRKPIELISLHSLTPKEERLLKGRW